MKPEWASECLHLWAQGLVQERQSHIPATECASAGLAIQIQAFVQKQLLEQVGHILFVVFFLIGALRWAGYMKALCKWLSSIH